MEKLQRLAPTLVICAVWGCASSTPPSTETPPAQPPSEPVSSGSDSTESTPSSGSESSASTQSGKTGGNDEKWEGEDAAAGKPVERTAAETRTTDVIRNIVLDNRQNVRDCYDRARKELPDLKGKMIIKFVLDPEGKVKTAELVMDGSELKAPAVVSCSIDAIKRMKFPPSSRGMDTTVNYPFDFKPDGGGGRPAKK